MSQNKVYQSLKEIGGEGSTDELRSYLKNEYPDLTLHQYATDRLRTLEKKGIVEIDDNSIPYYIYIVDEDWEGIPDNLDSRDFPPASGDNK